MNKNLELHILSIQGEHIEVEGWPAGARNRLIHAAGDYQVWNSSAHAGSLGKAGRNGASSVWLLVRAYYHLGELYADVLSRSTASRSNWRPVRDRFVGWAQKLEANVPTDFPGTVVVIELQTPGAMEALATLEAAAEPVAQGAAQP